MAEFFRNTVPFFVERAVPGRNDFAQIPALAERGKARTQVFFGHLDRQLAETKYLAGDRFTNADISAMCVTDFAEFGGITIPDDCGHVYRWFDQLNKRPSAQAWPRMAEAFAQAQAEAG